MFDVDLDRHLQPANQDIFTKQADSTFPNKQMRIGHYLMETHATSERSRMIFSDLNVTLSQSHQSEMLSFCAGEDPSLSPNLQLYRQTMQLRAKPKRRQEVLGYGTIPISDLDMLGALDGL